jgi:hypothetical protein
MENRFGKEEKSARFQQGLDIAEELFSIPDLVHHPERQRKIDLSLNIN